MLPKRRQSHQGDKLCDVSTVPLVARGPVFLARGSDADGEPHYGQSIGLHLLYDAVHCGTDLYLASATKPAIAAKQVGSFLSCTINTKIMWF